ncbi:MAG TPA: MASE4 domain-containing protein [Noviherbaspirillum sp.]|nr:MASE4 domain-containing protein [Noviherbaspirillum sp.]
MAVIVVSVLVFVALVPVAKMPLEPVWAFIPVYETLLVTNDLITALLLYGQFSILRERPLAILASGYLFTGLMAAFHALTFPGLFTPGGLLGAGTQTTAWLYMFWHAGFPLFVIAFSLLKERPAAPLSDAKSSSRFIALCVALTVLLAGGFTLVAAAGDELLPVLLAKDGYTVAMHIVVTAVWATSLAALIVLFRHRSSSLLELWLMVVVFAWLVDVALSAQLNAGRFDLGFYAGRIYGAVAASFILARLLIENTGLYAQLGIAHSRLAAQNRELQHEIAVRQKAEASLQHMYDELEDRVRERTASLEAAMKEMDSFTYTISHDLKTPLRAVSGYAGILKEDYGGELNEDASGLISEINENATRMQHLIDDLLAFSRIARKPIARNVVDMDALAREVIAELEEAEKEKRKIAWHIQPLPASRGEHGLLKQVWVNLLSNAIKFSSIRTTPVIRIGSVDEPEETVYFVEDNGIGFSMEYYDKLFGVFQRLHVSEEFPGTGVGLAIVQRIVERHGGRVWAEGWVGKGARFQFALPKVDEHERD